MKFSRFLFAASALAVSLGSPAEAQDRSDFVLSPAMSTSAVTFSSDHFDYERSSSVIHLNGHVELYQSSGAAPSGAPPGKGKPAAASAPIMRSENMWLYLEERRAKAVDFVEVQDEQGIIFGDAGEFDFETKAGSVKNASAGAPPWRIHGVLAEFDAKHNIYFRHARFTSCNLDPVVHYHFWASSLHVKPNSYLLSWNTVFFIRGVPVFYTPIFWKSLDPNPLLRTRTTVGEDKRRGFFGKTTTLYDPLQFPHIHGKLYLDYYQLEGWGVGDETVFRSQSGHGGVYAYHIREHMYGNLEQGTVGRDRWVVVGDDFQKLTSKTNFQMSLQTQSDQNFNNDYSRSNNYPVLPQLLNSAALVRNSSAGTLRLSYSRYDVEDLTLNRYVKQTESYPRMDFYSRSFSIFKLPFLNGITAFADHTYTRGQSYLLKTSGVAWNASQSYHLFRSAVFSPSVGASESYSSIYRETIGGVPVTFLDSFTPRYNAAGDLRLNTYLGDLDFGHSYVRRMTPNTFNVDKDVNDKGVETNASSLTDVLYPHRDLFLRLQTSYDYRTFLDHTVGFRDRVAPMTADLDWNAMRNLNVSFRNSYQLNGGDQAFAMQADWGQPKGDYFGFGISNSTASAEHYYVSQEIGWSPSSGTWRISGALRSDVRTLGGVHRLDLFLPYDKEVTITKNFHDFFFKIFFRQRPGGVRETSVQFQMLIDNARWVKENEDHFSAPWRLWKAEDR